MAWATSKAKAPPLGGAFLPVAIAGPTHIYRNPYAFSTINVAHTADIIAATRPQSTLLKRISVLR